MYKVGAATNEKENDIFDVKLELPPNLPESDKVKEFRKNDCSIIEVYWYLFKKYIESKHSLLEINISSRIRKKITVLMNTKYKLSIEMTKKAQRRKRESASQNTSNDDTYIIPKSLSLQIGGDADWQMDEQDLKAEIIKDLMPLFEDCRKEVSSLLQQSYRSFQFTEEYSNIIREVANNGESKL